MGMMTLKLKIEDSFYQPEERDGYFVSAEMKRIWAVELDLLNEFARVCDKLNLNWFVHAGTMLGTVRHHGFIPWDDDVDVVMPRKDYEKLCASASSFFAHPYFFQNDETDPGFAKNFSRLRNSSTTAIVKNFISRKYPFNQGIYIDIFPYDNIPDDVELRHEYYDRLTLLSGQAWGWMDIVHRYHPRKELPTGKRIRHFIRHLYFKYVLRKQDEYKLKLEQHYNLVTKYKGMDTECVGESIVPPLGRWEWKREWVENVVYMPFEMLSVPVPVGYAECLETGFGKDWRVPKQVGSLHGSILFDVDKPYTEYLK
jgi:lipopolysaccharide cholinephosphotransferase